MKESISFFIHEESLTLGGAGRIGTTYAQCLASSTVSGHTAPASIHRRSSSVSSLLSGLPTAGIISSSPGRSVVRRNTSLFAESPGTIAAG